MGQAEDQPFDHNSIQLESRHSNLVRGTSTRLPTYQDHDQVDGNEDFDHKAVQPYPFSDSKNSGGYPAQRAAADPERGNYQNLCELTLK
jgi:hypothetical protein